MKLYKTLLFAVIITALSNTGSAQKIGVKAGANLATLSGGNDSSIGSRTGFYVGAFKEMRLIPELLFLQPEVQYSSQGFSSDDITGEKVDYAINYVNIPIVAKVYFLKLFSIEAGPQFGFKVGDNFEGTASDNIQTFDLAGVFGLNLNFPMGLSINTRYVMGFSEVIKDTNQKTSVFQVGAAFKF
jgi:hypothetical protein